MVGPVRRLVLVAVLALGAGGCGGVRVLVEPRTKFFTIETWRWALRDTPGYQEAALRPDEGEVVVHFTRLSVGEGWIRILLRPGWQELLADGRTDLVEEERLTWEPPAWCLEPMPSDQIARTSSPVVETDRLRFEGEVLHLRADRASPGVPICGGPPADELRVVGAILATPFVAVLDVMIGLWVNPPQTRPDVPGTVIIGPSLSIGPSGSGFPP